MNCRTFHRNLEDYLQDGLDFSDRFGMERHAQQCISCGKELNDAQKLHGMVHELQRVKAPPNFESAILNKIAARKARDRFSVIRSFWIYGFELPSWRKMILASSGLAVLGLGIFYASRHTALIEPASPPPTVVSAPAKEIEKPGRRIDTKDEPGANTERPFAKQPAAAQVRKALGTIKPSSPSGQEYSLDRGFSDTEYVEYQVIGPGNHPLTIRFPRYRQMSEENFIQNVSH